MSKAPAFNRWRVELKERAGEGVVNPLGFDPLLACRDVVLVRVLPPTPPRGTCPPCDRQRCPGTDGRGAPGPGTGSRRGAAPGRPSRRRRSRTWP